MKCQHEVGMKPFFSKSDNVALNWTGGASFKNESVMSTHVLSCMLQGRMETDVTSTLTSQNDMSILYYQVLLHNYQYILSVPWT